MGLRLKRLRFRAWHRGTREADLLLGRFADAKLDRLTPSELDEFERLLDCDDPSIVGWATGLTPVPEKFDNAIMHLLRNFKLDA